MDGVANQVHGMPWLIFFFLFMALSRPRRRCCSEYLGVQSWLWDSSGLEYGCVEAEGYSDIQHVVVQVKGERKTVEGSDCFGPSVTAVEPGLDSVRGNFGFRCGCSDYGWVQRR